MDTEFAVLMVAQGIYSVTNSSGHTFYIVDGDERAAVIDTGCTPGRRIMPLIRQYTQKPLLLILTHAHSDHIYHMDEFDEVYMNHREFELPDSFLRLMMEDKQLNLRQTKDIRTGAVIDLGKRTLEALEVPGHTPGSIVLWEKEGDHLFTGDAVGSGNDVWMQWPSALPLDRYYPSLLRLLRWIVERGGRMRLLGGHARQCFDSPLMPYNPLSLGWLCDLIDLVDQVLCGKIIGQPSDADIILEPEPPLRASYGRAVLQYMPSRVRS
ncbi:MAG: MBL fold metallo-hydrolase [Clostridia bacterium]|nr:MBL fold metallo-hydrolase [Clostridia bacterium]